MRRKLVEPHLLLDAAVLDDLQVLDRHARRQVQADLQFQRPARPSR